KRATILDRMQSLSDRAATDNRLFDQDEARAWDADQREVAGLDQQITREEEREALRRGDGEARPITPGMPRLVDDQGNPIRLLTPKERLMDTLPQAQRAAVEPGSMGRVIKGLVLGKWDGASPMERALGTAVGSAGVTVPTTLATEWLDLARSRSVC